MGRPRYATRSWSIVGQLVSENNATSDLLLLSGGVDSAAIAAIYRPSAALFVNYGQRPAPSEGRSATVISRELDIPFHQLTIDLRPIGAGLLLGEFASSNQPSPEWWPFRNQLLVSIAAAFAFRIGLKKVLVGSVFGDGNRHVDGRLEFYEILDALLRLQEGEISVHAPGIAETTEQLVSRSGLGEDLLGWTVSCHRSEFPCGSCPGCWKRSRVMMNLGLLQPRAES